VAIVAEEVISEELAYVIGWRNNINVGYPRKDHN
jgi:hypothetical protein